MPATTEISRSVAIVGRPNVGKSRLFNRLVGRRVSIVHDMPGVTRDLITEQVADGDYLLMDTGGIGLHTDLTPQVIADAIEEQADFAVNAAKVVLLVVDVVEGCAPLDLEIAHKLRRFGKQVILVANKADNEARAANQADFFAMNLGPAVLVSAEHGIGIPFLIQKIKDALGPAVPASPAQSATDASAPDAPAASTASASSPRPVRICLAGRPNVGKSSIGNKLLNAPRFIVSEIPGTTRDSVRALLDHTSPDGVLTRFELLDTAGRRPTNKQDTLDFYSTLRGDQALERAEVVFLVLDAGSGVTQTDKQLAGKIIENGSGLVLLVNKWDLAVQRFVRGGAGVEGYKSEEDFREKYTEAVRSELFFLPESPVLFVSAKTGLNIGELLEAARDVRGRQNRQLPTGRLNRAIAELMEHQPPRMVSGKHFKCYYAVQTDTRPLRVRLFCNSRERVDKAYERYLVAGIRKAFALSGVPVVLEFVGKPKDPARNFFTKQKIG